MTVIVNNISIQNQVIISSGGAPTGGGVITYADMGGPVEAGFQLEDNSATVNDPTGFTINTWGAWGVAPNSLSTENYNFFNANPVPQLYNVTCGAGSTYTNVTATVTQVEPGFMVFYFTQADFADTPVTFNYPFTFTL